MTAGSLSKGSLANLAVMFLLLQLDQEGVRNESDGERQSFLRRRERRQCLCQRCHPTVRQ